MARDPAFESQDGEAVPTREEARDALAELASDGVHLAARLVTPWWYHPALGLIVSLFTVAQALPTVWATTLVACAIVMIPLLVAAYRSRYGVWVSAPAGPRGRRLMFAFLGATILCMLTALVFRVTDAPAWWTAFPAVAVFITTVLLGRRYDEVLRREIAEARR